MPPFILERAKPAKCRIVTTYPCKKTYGPGVKVTDWERYLLTQPIDNNPFGPEKYDLRLPHYKAFGTANVENRFQTETADAMQQIYSKNELLDSQPNKKIMNFYTFDERADCNKEYNIQNLCLSHGEDYLTTMQKSYPPPYPYKMKRLQMQDKPFLENRRMRNFDLSSDQKFLDDNFNCSTSKLQKYKAHRWASYDILNPNKEAKK